MADEYIRRKDAAKLLGYIFGVDVVRRLHEVPAADVAPVVRCKDCKYHYDCGVHFCNRLRMDCPDDSDFFCSYGERMRQAKMDGGNENDP